jgi:hypothetical protein
MALVPLNHLVTHNGRSSRQHVTCRYKCGDACSKPAPNTSDNEYFGEHREGGLAPIGASGRRGRGAGSRRGFGPGRVRAR